jgi:hypothetical protein
MKPMKYTALAMMLVLLAGCATTFRPWKLSDIDEGMSREQVVQVLGEPDSVETENGAELLHYSYSENYNPPLAADTVQGRNASRGLEDKRIKQGLKEHRYTVKLVDGKVQNYEELTD